MRNELTNLLPHGRQRAIRRDYFIRLSVVIILVVTALSLAAAVLLLPTYVFLAASESAGKAHLASIESALSSSDDSALSAQLSALSRNAAILSALADAPSASSIMRAILAISHPGIILSGFIYSPATDKSQSTLAISGVAATRDALRNYQLTLQGAPFARSADLPVSAYAKDSAITFTITVTLAP